jgi:hypothetical protein
MPMRQVVSDALQAAGLDTPDVEALVARNLDSETRNWIVLAYVHAVSRRLKDDGTGDPRQGWLTLPEYAHVPVQAAGDNLDDLRTRIRALEKRIRGYANDRRKPEKLKEDRRQLRELKQLEKNVAPVLAARADLTVDGAVRVYEESRRGQGRKQRREAVKSRWRQ